MIQVLEARLEEVQGQLARMEGTLDRTFCRVELTEDVVSWLIEWIEAQDPDLAGTLSRLRSGSLRRQPVNQPNGDNNSDVRMTPRALNFSH